MIRLSFNFRTTPKEKKEFLINFGFSAEGVMVSFSMIL